MRPRRILLTTALVAVTLLAGVYATRPGWYIRLFHPLRYPNYIRTHARNYDLPPSLVAAVIYQESRFNEKARSAAGARGLMQLTPQTASGIAERTGGARFRARDLDDPEINIRYGTWYLHHLHAKYDRRSPRGSYDLTLAAYNAGQGKVDEWIAHDADGRLTVSEIPFQETRTYVKHVDQLTRDYRKAYPALR